MVSNRVKRNISGTLMVLAILSVISNAWEVAIDPTSGKEWFEVCAMLVVTYLCFDYFSIYNKRVKEGK